MADDEAVEWKQITCAERDSLYRAKGAGWRCLASLTDLSGIYGKPTVFTEWGTSILTEYGTRAMPRLRDHRYPDPDGGPDVRPCEHYVPTSAAEETS